MAKTELADRRWAARQKERRRCKLSGEPLPDWALPRTKVPPPEEILRGLLPPARDESIERCPEVLHGNAGNLIKNVPHTAVLISDPPYNQGYHYDQYEDDLSESEYKELLRSVFQGRKSVIMHYPEEMVNLVAPAVGSVSDVMAWVYPSNQSKQHRLVGWWNCKPDWTRTPQDYKNPTDKRVRLLMEAGKRARGYDWIEMNHVKNVADAGHPCPIPYGIAERLVLATTVPGDLVVDPFCGSGTILVAAVRNGRRAMGFDMSEAYCELARKNLRASEGTQSVASAAE